APPHPPIPHAEGRGADRPAALLGPGPHGVLPGAPGPRSAPSRVVEIQFPRARVLTQNQASGRGRSSFLPSPDQSRKEALMSTADLELFGPPDAESVYPRFTTVLRGYDPDQVHEYIMALVARTES